MLINVTAKFHQEQDQRATSQERLLSLVFNGIIQDPGEGTYMKYGIK